MKNIKKIVSVLCAIVFGVNMAFSASAEDVIKDETNSSSFYDNSDEYIEFVNPDSRIASNGDFEFEIKYSVTSDKFKFSDTKTRITVSAYIYDEKTKKISYNNEDIVVLTISSGLTYSKKYEFYADGEDYTFDLVDLDTSKKYVLEVSNAEVSTDVFQYIKGKGNLTNYEAIK